MFRRKITFNIVLSTVILLLAFGVIAGTIGYIEFSDETTEEYKKDALRFARAAGSYVDASRLDYYLKTDGNSEDYKTTADALDTLCNRVNVQFIYVIKPDSDYNHINFIFDAVNQDADFEPFAVGHVRETSNDEYREKYKRLYDGASDEETLVRDDGFVETGSHITALSALRNPDGSTAGIVCVQRQMDALTKARYDYLVKIMIAIAALIVLSVLLYIFFLRRTLIKPIKIITSETERFSSDPEPAEETLARRIKTKNEIGQLAFSIDKMENDMIEYIENLTRITGEKQRISTELKVASDIQQSMLNSVNPNRSEFDICASMASAKEVGGDFYDYFMIDDDRLCMVVADVSDKGVPAALFMTLTKILISDSTLLYQTPGEILTFVNRRICQNNKMNMFVTVWLGILEISTGILTYANAGHESPAVLKNGGEFKLLSDRHGFVLGGLSEIKYKNSTMKLEKGDCIFLYTDGVTEATSSEKELFSAQRMLDALNLTPNASPADLIENVKAEISSFAGDAPQFDDMTMLCARFFGKEVAGQITVDAVAESLDEVIRFINSELEAAGCDEINISKIDIVIDELFSNTVKYAYPSKDGTLTVKIGFEENPFRAVIAFVDSGVPFNPLEVGNPDFSVPPEKRKEGGLGICLVKKIMDNASYEYKDEMNILTLEKQINILSKVSKK